MQAHIERVQREKEAVHGEYAAARKTWQGELDQVKLKVTDSEGAVDEKLKV